MPDYDPYLERGPDGEMRLISDTVHWSIEGSTMMIPPDDQLTPAERELKRQVLERQARRFNR